MDEKNKYIVNILNKQNIKPSLTRIKIYEYISNNKNHPNAIEIYDSLNKKIPTLSKTTVYNTLKLFAAEGLIKAINIEDNEIRYDIILEEHGHFKCVKCDTIYDFNTGIDKLISSDLKDFKIYEKNVYFKGVCSKCC